MMEYLREIGRSDLVYTMFSQTSYPGWGYMLERGATTYWEQWNGYYSQIHACFTSADNWLYQGLAGIQADPEAPGFKNVIIKPAIVGDLTWVKAHHDSPYGRIVSSWQREDDRLTMEVTIPANASATVYVPAKTVGDIRVNGQMSSETEHVTFLGMEKESAVFAVDAGRYQFTSTRQQSQPTPQSVADAQTE
jgi:alpha-L-rhamnosidase